MSSNRARLDGAVAGRRAEVKEPELETPRPQSISLTGTSSLCCSRPFRVSSRSARPFHRWRNRSPERPVDVRVPGAGKPEPTPGGGPDALQALISGRRCPAAQFPPNPERAHSSLASQIPISI